MVHFPLLTWGRRGLGGGGGGSVQRCSQDIGGIKMMVWLLWCRCTQGAGEVTLAMAAAIETTQPSVPANEEVTPHHCLVWQGTLGSLVGPALLLWHQNRNLFRSTQHEENKDGIQKVYNKFFSDIFFKCPNKMLLSLFIYVKGVEKKKCHMLQPTSGPILILHSTPSRFA